MHYSYIIVFDPSEHIPQIMQSFRSYHGVD